MHKSHSTINKLALVLLSLVVLELILIGDRVEPVKAIKKKMYLKKLKKLLPILALVKPKKKIILLPIPIPMMQHNGQPPRRPATTSGQRPYLPFSPGAPASAGAPMSFIMMTQPGQVPPEMLSMSMMEPGSGPVMNVDKDPKQEPNQDEQLGNLRQKEQVMSMVMPSMTMTIQSEGGGHSAIELSTNMMPGNMADAKNHTNLAPMMMQHQPIQQQKQEYGMLRVQPVRPFYPPQITYSDNFGPPSHNAPGGGEPYYSSPWATSRPPLASPMKVFRKDRLRDRPLASTTSAPALTPSNQGGFMPQEHIELDDLIAVGPPQMRPFIQDSNGHLHVPVGPPNKWRPSSAEVEETDEVQTVASEPPVRPRAPLKSTPSRQVKGYNSAQQLPPTKNLHNSNPKPPAVNPMDPFNNMDSFNMPMDSMQDYSSASSSSSSSYSSGGYSGSSSGGSGSFSQQMES